jgi:hypothetical protein
MVAEVPEREDEVFVWQPHGPADGVGSLSVAGANLAHLVEMHLPDPAAQRSWAYRAITEPRHLDLRLERRTECDPHQRPAASARRQMWCATRRLVVSPAQPGGTRREVSGSDGLLGSER